MTSASNPRLPNGPPNDSIRPLESFCVSQARIELAENEIIVHIPIRANLSMGPDNLTRREREVLEALGPLRDRTNKEIGNVLNASERVIKFHIANLLKKMGVENRYRL